MNQSVNQSYYVVYAAAVGFSRGRSSAPWRLPIPIPLLHLDGEKKWGEATHFFPTFELANAYSVELQELLDLEKNAAASAELDGDFTLYRAVVSEALPIPSFDY